MSRGKVAAVCRGGVAQARFSCALASSHHFCYGVLVLAHCTCMRDAVHIHTYPVSPSLRLLLSDSSLNIEGKQTHASVCLTQYLYGTCHDTRPLALSRRISSTNNLYAPRVKVDREEVLPLYVSSAWQTFPPPVRETSTLTNSSYEDGVIELLSFRASTKEKGSAGSYIPNASRLNGSV